MANETARRADEERRKSICPVCGIRANPTSVSCSQRIMTITYHCVPCDLAWETKAPDKARGFGGI